MGFDFKTVSKLIDKTGSHNFLARLLRDAFVVSVTKYALEVVTKSSLSFKAASDLS
jgi:hypothetical protein